jgi:hypothetical protein
MASRCDYPTPDRRQSGRAAAPTADGSCQPSRFPLRRGCVLAHMTPRRAAGEPTWGRCGEVNLSERPQAPRDSRRPWFHADPFDVKSELCGLNGAERFDGEAVRCRGNSRWVKNTEGSPATRARGCLEALTPLRSPSLADVS